MNERKKVNKIIHTYVDVSKYEDYTDYKGLITALIDWKNEQLTLIDVVASVLCADNEKGLFNLTIGKKYTVIKEYYNHFMIKDDSGSENKYHKFRFDKN